MSTSPDRVVLQANFPAVGATVAEEKYLTCPFPGSWRVVEGPYIAPDDTTTEDASNYTTLTVKKGSDTIGSWSTQDSAQGTLTKGTPAAMVYTEQGENAVIAQGEALEVAKADAASGAAFDGTVLIPLERVRG